MGCATPYVFSYELRIKIQGLPFRCLGTGGRHHLGDSIVIQIDVLVTLMAIHDLEYNLPHTSFFVPIDNDLIILNGAFCLYFELSLVVFTFLTVVLLILGDPSADPLDYLLVLESFSCFFCLIFFCPGSSGLLHSRSAAVCDLLWIAAGKILNNSRFLQRLFLIPLFLCHNQELSYTHER